MVIFGLIDENENVLRLVNENGKYTLTNDKECSVYTTNTIAKAVKSKSGGLGNHDLPYCPSDFFGKLKVVQLAVNVVATYENKV